MFDLKRIVEILISSKYDGKGNKQATADLVALSKAATGIGAALAVGGAAVVTTLTGMAVAASRSADELRDLSIRTGIQVDLLSELKFAAEQTGTNINELGDSMKFLLRNADAAAHGSKETQAAFDRVGISSDRLAGLLKDPKALLLAVADGMKTIDTQAGRTASQLDLFGRSGTRLTEFLSGGSEQIKGLTDEAQRLGLTLSQTSADAADKFQDAVSKARATTGAFGQAISTALLPKLTEMVNSLSEVVAKGAEFIRQHPQLVAAVAQYGAVAVAGGVALAVTSQIATTLIGLKAGLDIATGPGVKLMKALSDAGAVANLGKIAALVAEIATGIGAALAVVGGLSAIGKHTDQVTARKQRITANAGDQELISLVSDRDAQEASLRHLNNQKDIEDTHNLIDGLDALIDKRLELLDATKKLTEEERIQASLTVGPFQSDPAGDAKAEQLKALQAQLEALNQTASELSLPDQIDAARLSIAKLRQSGEDLEFIRQELIKLQDAGKGVDKELLAILEKHRDKSKDTTPREVPELKTKPHTKVPFTLEDVPIIDPSAPTEFEKRIESTREAIGGLEDVGTSAILGIADSLTNVLGAALTGGESGFKNFGDFAVKTMAAVAAAIAGALLQLVALNAALAIFTGGTFSPFAGFKKFFGLAGGGLALAGGGQVGGPGGIDAAGPVMLNRGELVVPTPLTGRLSSFLDKFASGQLAPAGAGSNVSINVTTGAFWSKSEELSIISAIRDGLEELDGRRR